MAGAFPGGFVTKSPTATVGGTDTGFGPEGGSASGMWTLDQALALKGAGLWPSKIKEKYLWAFGRNDEGTAGINGSTDRSSPVQVGAAVNWLLAGGGGVYHSLAIKTDGTMWGFGSNDQGMLGDNTAVNRSSPVQIGGLTTWSQISGGGYHSMALKTNGTIWVWGGGMVGQLGDGTTISKSSPVQVGALTTWSSIAANYDHNLAIKTDGTMWSFGYNNQGQLGDGTTADKSSPIQIGSLTTWSKITRGGFASSMAIKTDGTLWAWGYNDAGQLGNNTVVNKNSPIQVGVLTTWSEIASGISDSMALKTDGTLWTWGKNSNGQVGDNTVIFRSSPIQVGALTNWSSIANGLGEFKIALKTDGTMWTWGRNDDGRIGDNTVIKRSSPVQVGSLTTWSKIAAGAYHGMAIETDGTWYSWGGNGGGGLGVNTITNRSSPVQVGTLSVNTNDWSQIASGYLHSMSLKTDGTMWLWGKNNYGQVGDSTVNNKSSPVQIGTPPPNWSLAVGGYYSTTGIKTDGTLWTWGSNTHGGLGDDTVTRRSSPVQIGTSTWSKIGIGNYAQFNLAIKTDGTLWTFGYNNAGQIGDNSRIKRSSPVQVGALTTWSKIARGKFASMALKTDGTMWLWGSAGYGQLGNNADVTVSRSSPIQIGSLTTWSEIARGDNHSMALKTDGTLWTWGRNDFGAIGDNTVVNRSSPVQLGALTTWSKIAGGGNHSMAIKTDGTMWTWGVGSAGRLGDSTTIYKSSPIQVGALTTWSTVAGGQDHSMALKTDGTMWLWGFNNYGRLGDNTTTAKSSPVQIGSATWSIIAGGSYHSVGVETDGTWYSWGANALGNLGDNTVVNKSSPVQIGTLGVATTDWSKISAGYYHSAAIKTNGTLWLWGIASYGVLGNNNQIQKSSPTQVGALTNWSKIDAGGTQWNIAVKTDGTLWTWGRNDVGQLGANNRTYRSSPVQVGALTTWSHISGGAYHSMAIKTDGSLWTWGFGNGRLGDGTIVYRSSPVQIGSLTTWSSVTAGNAHSMAVKNDGTLWTWGGNDSGEIGDNTIIKRSSPIQVGALTTWSLVAGSAYSTLAIKTDGTMWAWGYGERGGNGEGRGIFRSSPIQVGAEVIGWSLAATSPSSSTPLAIKADGTMWTWGNDADGQLGLNTFEGHSSSPVQIGSINTWSKIANGGNHAMALKADGTMWSWGNNGNGQVGNNTGVARSSPVQIGALTTWSLVAAGDNHQMALKTDGTMWLWGQNSYGRLGDNTVLRRSSPVQIGALTTWSKISAGNAHNVALKTDGTLWLWGYNFAGQLGDNTVINRSSPVQIGSLTTWAQIAGGGNHSAAIKTDGTLWTFGYSTYTGQLGDNTVLRRSSPVQVGALTTWSKVALGYEHSMALKIDGTMWLWGNNSYGILGDNTRTYRSSPVQVGALTTWSSIACTGGSNSIAIETDGSWYSWGSGRIGDDTTIRRSSPVQVGSDPAAATNHWAKISGGLGSLAISAE